MIAKSPFFIIQEFLSPLMCEDIINRLNNIYPDTDINDAPLKTIRYNNLTEIRVLPMLEDIIPTLEQYYGFTHRGILPFKFEWLIAGTKTETAICENSILRENKWSIINDIDFTAIIFLNDYNQSSDFDQEFEVYGGKLEFPTHQFGFTPKRGTLIFFPSGPNFVHGNSGVLAGELNQMRINFVATERYKYDIKKFPGNYKVWFKDL